MLSETQIMSNISVELVPNGKAIDGEKVPRDQIRFGPGCIGSIVTHHYLTAWLAESVRTPCMGSSDLPGKDQVLVRFFSAKANVMKCIVLSTLYSP